MTSLGTSWSGYSSTFIAVVTTVVDEVVVVTDTVVVVLVTVDAADKVGGSWDSGNS
jgi:hypothetical protein